MSVGPTPITSEPAQPQADPALVAQIQRDTMQAIFGDKFNGDVDKAREGYWHQNKTISEQAALLAEVSQYQQPQPIYQHPQVADDPFARIQAESLVPADALRAAIRAEARQLVHQELEPMTAVLNARERIGREYPEFIQNEAAIVQFAANDPNLNQRVQRLNSKGLPDEAMLTMLQAWKYSNPTPSNPPAAQHAAAALPGAAAGAAVRAVPDTGADDARARLADAIKYAQATKDETAVWDEYFKDIKVQLPIAGQ